MKNNIAQAARLKVIDALVAEIDRQGATAALADVGFDVASLAKEAIDAADGDVVPFPLATGES